MPHYDFAIADLKSARVLGTGRARASSPARLARHLRRHGQIEWHGRKRDLPPPHRLLLSAQPVDRHGRPLGPPQLRRLAARVRGPVVVRQQAPDAAAVA